METSFYTRLRTYAEIAVRIGVNLQSGQRLLVRGASLEHEPLVHAIAEVAYQAGARLVDVMWVNEPLERIRFAHAPRDSFDEFPKWRVLGPLEYAERGDAILTISATDPDLLAGQDSALVNVYQSTIWKEMGPFLKHISSNTMNWCVISAARPVWARKLFPDLPEAEATGRLWEVIFQMCRVDREAPLQAWQDHLRSLQTRSRYLTEKGYHALRFTAPGTDLTVGLPRGHRWVSACETARNGIEFTANIPTEEVFTMADRARAEGVVSVTKPLNYGGTLIEGMVLRFENGRVVHAQARTNEAILQQMIATDEGAARLGEIALVPDSSPISRSGLLFYNTLYDENASSHLALGRAYKFNYTGGLDLSDEQFAAVGGNQSLIHVDFMIGSAQMDVDGLTEDGRAEPLMRKGEWAFDV